MGELSMTQEQYAAIRKPQLDAFSAMARKLHEGAIVDIMMSRAKKRKGGKKC